MILVSPKLIQGTVMSDKIERLDPGSLASYDDSTTWAANCQFCCEENFIGILKEDGLEWVFYFLTPEFI